MKNPRAKVLSAVAALCGSLGLGLLAHATPAAAATITIGGCDAASGSEDTASIQVTLDDAAFAGGAVVPLHDRIGSVGGFYNGKTYDPNVLDNPDNAMSTPVCGAQRSAAGVITYKWLYCVDKQLNACGNAPWFTTGGATANVLTNLDKARIAWILDHVITQPLAGGGTTEASNRTQATRAQRHRLIWCVSEHQAANVPAFDYLAPYEDPLTCPDWPTIDTQLNLNPQVAIAAAPATAAVGSAVTFTVTTNVSPLTVTPAGLDSLALCAPQAGVTLAGGQLTIVGALAGKQVTLCGTRASGGSGGVTVAISGLTVSTLQFWRRAENATACQGMVSTEAVLQPGATAQAQATWLAVLDTTTVAPTTTVPPSSTTSTTDPGSTTTQPIIVLPTTVVPGISGGRLPDTGAGRSARTMFAGVLLLTAGVGLVLVGRRTRRTA